MLLAVAVKVYGVKWLLSLDFFHCYATTNKLFICLKHASAVYTLNYYGTGYTAGYNYCYKALRVKNLSGYDFIIFCKVQTPHEAVSVKNGKCYAKIMPRGSFCFRF